MRKILVFILVVTMLFSGCGKDSIPESDITNNSSEENSKVRENTGEAYKKPKMKGNLTISVMTKTEFLETAAKSFMKEYPNVHIEIHDYQGTTDEKMVEDYRTNLNTKIMSKKAEDIIFTSELPVKKYMDMGVFEDLSDYVSQTPELNDENYFMNVIESARDDSNHLYIVPWSNSFWTINFDTKVIPESGQKEKAEALKHRFSESVSFAKKYVDESKLKKVYLTQTDNGLDYMNNLIQEYRSDLFDEKNKKANIDSKQYVEWLNQAKELQENGYFPEENSIDYYHEEFHFTIAQDYNLQAAFYNLEPSSSVLGAPIADKDGNVYVEPTNFCGINSASKNKELAWEFVKYLLSEEMQSLPCVFNLPVNRKGFDVAVQRQLKLYNDGNSGEVALTDYKDLLEKWTNQINKCNLLDSEILRFCREENEKFVKGTQSAEKTAQMLQKKITQYYNE